MVLHHRAGSDLLRPLAVAALLLSAFFDVLVHPLLFLAYASHMLAFWHRANPPRVICSLNYRPRPAARAVAEGKYSVNKARQLWRAPGRERCRQARPRPARNRER